MSHRLATPDRGALHGEIPLAKILLASALLAALSGVLGLTVLLVAATPQDQAQAARSTHVPATASVQDRAVTRADPSVPDASSVFAGWNGTVEALAPTF